MLLKRTTFFLLLFTGYTIPLVAGKLLWLLHSRPVMGVMAFPGHGQLGDQMPLDYSVIYFPLGNDTIWFNGLGNLHLPPNSPVPIRYNTRDPHDAQVNIFAGIWGKTLVYGGIPLAMLLVVFLHPDVVPRRARVRLSRKKPWILIVHSPSSPLRA